MIPNLLRSLIKLSIYKIGVHFSKEQDQESFAVRSSSRICLSKIQLNGNKQVQAKLVNVRYARVMIIAISATGGIGEQQDDEIKYQLKNIYQFFYCLHLGRNDQYPLPTFSPLPLLAKTCLDRNEEEGGNEEVDAQLSNSGKGGNIKLRANQANGLILNFYIDRKNTRPRCHAILNKQINVIENKSNIDKSEIDTLIEVKGEDEYTLQQRERRQNEKDFILGEMRYVSSLRQYLGFLHMIHKPFPASLIRLIPEHPLMKRVWITYENTPPYPPEAMY
ncbi:MAG: hypothetical protein EZS28_004984 [Streblomastix strix]|uniref:Uncharacterized protein n=1 Tax=Streblomastix strix TaxID=222440 RepID=A0A5J4WYD9_9EUKA|nr:MAG: hypothetical protein EZS28_004984 [Streblomastix strix]